LFNDSFSFPFATEAPIVMACHFTGIFDVNRNQVLPNDQFSLVEDWAFSLKSHQVNGIIFHNNFSALACAKHQHERLKFIDVQYDTRYNPNVYRYFIYREFLRLHAPKISGVFITDISDVVMINNPFLDSLFKQNKDTLFCGDEPVQLQNDWMINHATHLRQTIPDYAAFESTFKNEPLLNCGIIGGHTHILIQFVEQLATIHEKFNNNNDTAYTGDMGAFNYLVRTRFNNCVMHGYPVNTVFKAYETERTDCWFRHK